ncbi:cytochrome c-type biogenesis protein CcmH [Methylobacillus caricis]|uniref:cytochrome c-type biogenesis protein n=1 Tax=Methylobacillus caricis TaxID=1971611 RepID=UPI001CFF8131|nr:cytochrome c-type biogenesis protein [Methylobacillus caricis]MCB5188142.1 cytochrome c-type biogenesis protein CcmH [Methylobacillus caricis]
MKYCLIIAGLLFSGPAFSTQEAALLVDNPKIEAQVSRLAEELRCLVCQNQTLADSSAPLAEDLRNEIREMAAKNMSDQQIIDHLVARYGDFVRYRPPFKASTAVLWAGPFVLLVLGMLFVSVLVRRRERQVASLPLTPEQSRQLAELLKQEQ